MFWVHFFFSSALFIYLFSVFCCWLIWTLHDRCLFPIVLSELRNVLFFSHHQGAPCVCLIHFPQLTVQTAIFAYLFIYFNHKQPRVIIALKTMLVFFFLLFGLFFFFFVVRLNDVEIIPISFLPFEHHYIYFVFSFSSVLVWNIMVNQKKIPNWALSFLTY